MTKKSLERIVGRKVREEEYLTAELVLPTMSDYMDEGEFLRSFGSTVTMCGLVEKMADVIEDLLSIVAVQGLALKKYEKS